MRVGRNQSSPEEFDQTLRCSYDVVRFEYNRSLSDEEELQLF